MKQILLILSFAAIGIGIHAQEVIVMDKTMFLDKVFDYTDSQAKEWKYKGDRPAIIDLYADWCGPCMPTGAVLADG